MVFHPEIIAWLRPWGYMILTNEPAVITLIMQNLGQGGKDNRVALIRIGVV